MAVNTSEGCELVDSIPEHCYCKQCAKVANRLVLTTCCDESFCQTCITSTQEQGQPCPVCERRIIPLS